MIASSRNYLLRLLCCTCLILTPLSSAASDDEPALHRYDVIIYGNTVAAIAAAVQATRMNTSVAIVFPGDTLGGLTTSGLGWTDSKSGNTIGGIAREFYGKVFDYYQSPDAWEHETRADYIARNIHSQPGPAIDESREVQWTFEPKVAEAILEKWVEDEEIPVFRNESIDRSGSGLIKEGTRILAFKTESGSAFAAKMFIDAGYEGDLMEAAGIPYRVGRESRQEYEESEAGFSMDPPNRLSVIDPYRRKGDASSGLIPGVQRVIADPGRVRGDADPVRLQSFNYRLCLTQVADNQIPFSKPQGYNESHYEILFRYIESGYFGPFFTSQLMPNLKTDSNANGQVSTDLIGGNFDAESNYAEYSYEKRKATAHAHKVWAQGLLWTLANHERVLPFVRATIRSWGYAKDEWVSNDNWPYEIYIREGRRMDGVYTMTQGDIQDPKSCKSEGIIGVGSYTLDVHQVERVVVDGRIYDEGLVHVPTPGPFTIPFGAIIPKASDATNFINPVTMSSTHIALSAIRMEPTYMVLGQSAATAAVLAIEQDVKVQDVDLEKLMARLKADGQVLESYASSLKSTYFKLLTLFFTLHAYSLFL